MSSLFWRLSNGYSSKGRAESDDAIMDKLEAQYGKMQPWIPMHRVSGVPFYLKLAGKQLHDIIWTWYSQCIITDRVLEMFRDQGFTGFQVLPVLARWKKSRTPNMPEIPTLWELIPTGWGGMAPEESGIHRVAPPDGHPELLRYSALTDPSKLIDDKQWDGSDFFILWPMPTYINVTDRVASFIRANRLKTAVLERIDKLTVDEKSSGYTPGPLEWYLPEPRAREIGEPLGIYRY